jgi:NTP pyrophosphatase (non-canonical NTP hydrolase)
MSVIDEIADQRSRNHARWGELSIEHRPADYRGWLPTLGEEYGEVCRAETLEGDRTRLRAELVDVAAVALMWIDAIDREYRGIR